MDQAVDVLLVSGCLIFATYPHRRVGGDSGGFARLDSLGIKTARNQSDLHSTSRLSAAMSLRQ
jgi:hypothetical protein